MSSSVAEQMLMLRCDGGRGDAEEQVMLGYNALQKKKGGGDALLANSRLLLPPMLCKKFSGWKVWIKAPAVDFSPPILCSGGGKGDYFIAQNKK